MSLCIVTVYVGRPKDIHESLTSPRKCFLTQHKEKGYDTFIMLLLNSGLVKQYSLCIYCILGIVYFNAHIICRSEYNPSIACTLVW